VRWEAVQPGRNRLGRVTAKKGLYPTKHHWIQSAIISTAGNQRKESAISYRAPMYAGKKISNMPSVAKSTADTFLLYSANSQWSVNE